LLDQVQISFVPEQSRKQLFLRLYGDLIFLLFIVTHSLFLKFATNFLDGMQYVNWQSFSLKKELLVFRAYLRHIWHCKFPLDQFNELVFILGVLGTLM
jgi:hypothetical protein